MTKKSTIEDMHKLATERNGKFLSIEYLGNKNKYEWQCSARHIWRAAASNITTGNWCPKCSGRSQLAIEDMHKLASENNGKFISSEYTNSKTKHKWQCSEGHVWEATPNNIKNNKTWCYQCVENTQNLTINDMHNIAIKRGGKFLSKKYINSQTKHKWQCDKNHIWEATPSKVKSGSWCSICFYEGVKSSIEHMHNVAAMRGGKFISEEYINSQTKHKWQCNKGHIWEAIPNSIQRGQWCPHCVTYRGEEICRKIISKMFGDLFIKCRPEFLRQKNNRKLELDGYNEQLKIAFEYHGIQHYKPVEHFGGEKSLIKIKELDKLKLDLCVKAGVRVIVVPTFPDNFNELICQHMIELAVITADIEIPLEWVCAVDKLFDSTVIHNKNIREVAHHV